MPSKVIPSATEQMKYKRMEEALKFIEQNSGEVSTRSLAFQAISFDPLSQSSND